MKKLTVIIALFASILIIAAIAIAGGKGAVKDELFVHPGDLSIVGWVILNTTASGKLNVTAHLDNGNPNEEFIVNVWIYPENPESTQDAWGKFFGVATLSTNEQGKGNAHAQVDLAQSDPGIPDDAGTIYVQVAVRKPYTELPRYTNTIYGVAVPLK